MEVLTHRGKVIERAGRACRMIEIASCRPRWFESALILALLIAWTTGSGCFLFHDYRTCSNDASCPFTHRCVDGLCRPRAEYPACNPGQSDDGCPQGTTCDPVLAVCLAADADIEPDLSDQAEDLEDQLEPEEPRTDLAQDSAEEAECDTDGQCSNHFFCDGEERCLDGVCRSGEPPELADEWYCTVDRCDEETDQITHEAHDLRCRDDNLCSTDRCDPETQNTDDGSGCVRLPVGDGTACGMERVCRGIECVPAGCGNRVVELSRDEECDDGNLLDHDGCDHTCHWEPRLLDLSREMSAPDQVIRGVDPQDAWGFGLACADFNGDGVGDLATWANQAHGRSNLVVELVPEIRVILGPLPQEPVLSLSEINDWIIYAIYYDYYFRALVGDVNEDGMDDLVISTPGYDDNELYNVGAVLVYLGFDDSTRLPIDRDLSTAMADITFLGTTNGALIRALGVADYDGDGHQDILFGVNQTETGALVLHSNPTVGRHYLSIENGHQVITGDPEMGIFLGSGGVALYQGSSDRSPAIIACDAGGHYYPGEDVRPGRTYLVPLPLSLEEPQAIQQLASFVTSAPSNALRTKIGPIFDVAGDVRPEMTVWVETNNPWGGTAFALSLPDRAEDVVYLNPYLADGVSIFQLDHSNENGQEIQQADFTEDGRDDLVLLSFGHFLEHTDPSGPGRIAIFPTPLQLGRSIRLDEQNAPLEIWGAPTHQLRSIVRCDLDGDQLPETVIGLCGAGIQDGEGEIWIYHSLPWSFAE
ncbi:MAG: hypothetical protein JW797_06410 [Bradymonadales bacterium]|nr:hypothetical protein [Bradymonadales bacterium]